MPCQEVVLLYFYPKDETPGCTKEACALRDRMSDLKKDGVQSSASSFDSGESHKAFIAKHDLNFPFAGGHRWQNCDCLWRPERQATTALVASVSSSGLDGKIAHVTDNKDADVHISEMARRIQKLKKPSP